MNPNGDSSLSIPMPLAAEIQAAADREHRPAVDFVRDALASYLEHRSWRLHAEQETTRARALGLAEDAAPLTPAYRQTMRDKIAQGLQSLREGRAIDGEAVFAEMEAEFQEMEGRGNK